jgi:disulfide bond formation protein DsbB
MSFISFLAVCTILGTSAYLQIHDGFVPCPLCTLQRVAFVALGILFLLNILVYKITIARIFSQLLILASAAAGMVLAGRQVWLQLFHAGEEGECGVSLQYMLDVLPLNEVMAKVFAGSAECAKRGFSFLWLNMAEWSLLLFVGFFIVGLSLLFCKKQ